MHPRSKHAGRYDFTRLTAASPGLRAFIRKNPAGEDTVDWSDPAAVKALNAAVLAADYGVKHWDLPEGYLCPPIPGRADYIHHLADLLGPAARGAGTRILDLGVGASCVYPLLGRAEYGWSFVGTDTDEKALESAREIVAANGLTGIELRPQASPEKILEGVVRDEERFAACLTNPPFYGSEREAAEASGRKRRNLGHSAGVRNFGGAAHELWRPGGEAAFVRRLIEESARRPKLCGWYTSLVSRSENLHALRHALKAANAAEVRELPMAQGNKLGRALAWRFA